MSKARPSDDQLKQALFQGHFGKSQDLPPSDPLVPTQMLVDIEQIVPYAHNPRRAANPIFLEIKESVRAVGLKQILIVTRRPGDKHYTLKNGGNTRLKALKELYAETGDDQFHRVTCMFEPWESESSALAAHLIENDTRSELIFIDRARAIRDFRDRIAEEQGKTPSQRELVRALETRGYRITRTNLPYLDYAMDVLAEAIPFALNAGAGRPVIQALRRLESVLGKYLTAQRIELPARELFLQALAAEDDPDLGIERVRAALEEALAERTQARLSHVRLQFDVLLAESTTREDSEDAPDSGVDSTTEGNDAATAPTAPPTSIEDRFAPRLRAVPPARQPAATADAHTAQPPTPAASVSPTTAAPPEDLVATLATFGLDELRERMRIGARRFAQMHGLADCVMPCDFNIGFYVDVPEPLGATTRRQAFVWWLLASLSGQFLPNIYASSEQIAKCFPPDARVREALAAYARGERDHARLGLPTTRIEEWGALAFFDFTEQDFVQLRAIIILRRAMHKCALASAAERGHEVRMPT